MGAGICWSRTDDEHRKPLGKESVIVASQQSFCSSDSSIRPELVSSRQCTCSCLRAWPVCNSLCCAISAAAAVVGIRRHPDVHGTLHMFSSSSNQLELLAKGLTWYYVGVLVILILSLVAGIISAYAPELRKRHWCSLRLLYIRSVQVLLLVLYILQLLMSYIFLVVLVLVAILDAVCESGESAVRKLVELSELLRGVDNTAVTDVFEHVRDFSEIDEDVLTAFLNMFAASALLMASLGPLLACITSRTAHTHWHAEPDLLDASLGSLDLPCQSTQTDIESLKASEEKEVQVAFPTEADQLKQELASLMERLALQAALLNETQLKLEKAEYNLAQQILETAGERRRTNKAEGELEGLMRMHAKAQQHLHKWRESTTSSTSSATRKESQATASDRLARFTLSKAATPSASNQVRNGEIDESQISTSQPLAKDRLARFNYAKVSNRPTTSSELENWTSTRSQASTTSALKVAESKANSESSTLLKKPKESIKRNSGRGQSRRAKQSKSTAIEADSNDVLDTPPSAPPPLPAPLSIPQESQEGLSKSQRKDAEGLPEQAPAAPW